MEMIEPDLKLVLQGLPDESSEKIGNAVADAVRALYRAGEGIDLRRMRRIVVTTDFAGELGRLSKETVSGNIITHTNEEYAQAVAKVSILPEGDDFEIVPVVNAQMAAVLALDDLEEHGESVRYVLHLFHHELCHVHDGNKKLDALRHIMLKQRYLGKDEFIGPLADLCWSEYVANRLSSSTANDLAIDSMTSSLSEAIVRTKEAVNAEIRAYRRHSDLGRLMDSFGRHGEFLVKTAAYVLGYIDGLGQSLSELSPEAADHLSDSYFEETWTDMHRALRTMYEKYPDDWHDLTVYSDLAAALESYYDKMGLVLSTTHDGRAYVHVPFRPGTI